MLNLIYTRDVSLGMFFVLAVVTCGMLGCESPTAAPLVEVVGEVTLDNRQLEDAYVVFVPREYRSVDGTINPIAYGKTDDDGRFELAAGDQRGVRQGQYRVLIFTSNQDMPNAENGRLDPMFDVVSSYQETRGSLVNRVVVRARYNLETTLDYEVRLTTGVASPTFELSSDTF